MYFKFSTSTIFLSIFLLFSTSLFASELSLQVQIPVERFLLPNGLTVLMHQDNRAPIVSYHTWFKVGSKNELPGQTGMAHLFEHMMFKGTHKYSNKEFDKILRASGVVSNAFTTNDMTAFFHILPSDKVELVMDIESDRMRNLIISEDNLKSELEVVKEERRMRVENHIEGEMGELMFSTLYKVHPYRWPVIGWMPDLNNVNVEKCKSFYNSYYAPNNAVLVVSGDFDMVKMKSLVQKYYGPMQSQSVKPFVLTPEPEPTASRVATLERNLQSQSLMISYPTVAAGQPEVYALDLFTTILGDGPSSRLYKKLFVEKQMVTSVGASQNNMQASGFVEVFSTLKSKSSASQVEKIIEGEIWRLANSQISEDEMLAAKNRVIKQYVDTLKTANGKSYAIAMSEIFYGGQDILKTMVEKYQAVTVEEVAKSAQKYLQSKRKSVVIAQPKAKE